MSSIMSRTELRSLPMIQQPHYEDIEALDRVIDEMEKLPPLVFAGECDDLRDKLAEVAAGRAFLLQGGDCAESFDAVTAQDIKDKLLVQLSMAVVMTYAAQVPVVKIGRIAGQYAKPRSKPTESRDGVTLPSYRGDAINGFDFTPEARRADPARLVRVYNASAATLNLVRAFVKGGFADLRGVHTWNRDFVGNSEVAAAYEELVAEIDQALAFMVACGVEDRALSTIDFYASHEALLLEYERALTRVDSRSQQLYGCSGHMLWIGERTRQLDGAHVELLRRVRNPLGIKLGPTTTPEQAIELADRLDPEREPGRITFITRMGANKVREVLPSVIQGVEATGRSVAPRRRRPAPPSRCRRCVRSTPPSAAGRTGRLQGESGAGSRVPNPWRWGAKHLRMGPWGTHLGLGLAPRRPSGPIPWLCSAHCGGPGEGAGERDRGPTGFGAGAAFEGRQGLVGPCPFSRLNDRRRS